MGNVYILVLNVQLQENQMQMESLHKWLEGRLTKTLEGNPEVIPQTQKYERFYFDTSTTPVRSVLIVCERMVLFLQCSQLLVNN